MHQQIKYIAIFLSLAGCSTVREWVQHEVGKPAQSEQIAITSTDVSTDQALDVYAGSSDEELLLLVGNEEAKVTTDSDIEHSDLLIPPGSNQDEQNLTDESSSEVLPVFSPTLTLNEVISSVYQSYPQLEAALYQRNVAQGEHLSAAGAFDLKLKGASENGPVGFYETYRQSVGLVQPTYGGGEIFSGYRIGQGNFEPWYQERETDGGGEFKLGASVPLARNRTIDQRRADLWKTGLENQLTEPDIQAQLIGFVQEASYAYWNWVAAGQNFRVAEQVLGLAESRTERIRRQVEEELIDPPELTDNLRLVAERKAKLASANLKLQQTAAKLSLYNRDAFGVPIVPTADRLPAFPAINELSDEQLRFDIQLALQSRPELQVLDFKRKQYEIDYAHASNGLLPELDAVIQGKQDVGPQANKKGDKSPFELEASLFLDVPLQRRKARGKMNSVQGKLAQLSAKRRLTEDKIVIDVQQAYAALVGAYEQVLQTTEAIEFAEDLARRERRNFEEGFSDLLKVTLREQYAAESATKRVDALQLYFQAQADYRAALAQDRLP